MRVLSVMITLFTLTLVSATAIAARPTPQHEQIPQSIIAPGGLLPVIVHHASPETRMAYRAAQASPEVLSAVPCTCGCVASLGHENNLDCYIDEAYPDGSVSYSMHGLDCYICQVITRDAVAGADAGMSPDQLRQMILERYSNGS
ncbi:MAG: PCYCGC motif-containing (lipo)protein [Thermomicrobiales bacterium]